MIHMTCQPLESFFLRFPWRFPGLLSIRSPPGPCIDSPGPESESRPRIPTPNPDPEGPGPEPD